MRTGDGSYIMRAAVGAFTVRFIGIFHHGLCCGVAATDGEAHNAVEAHPRLARASVDHINARELARGTGSPLVQDDALFSGGHVRDVTDEVIACMSSMWT